MTYDDAKLHGDRVYRGMRVGVRHDWDYPDGRWREQKVDPDQWLVSFHSRKRRRHPAPPGSGAPPGAMFHWLLVAHQRVRKVDANEYETFLEGAKWLVGHRRPGWRRWSTEYPGRPSARDRTIAVLRETLARLEADREARAPRIEAALSPGVYDPRDARLEDWIRPTPEELELDAEA